MAKLYLYRQNSSIKIDHNEQEKQVFKDGGGWGEFFRMLPSVSVPPILAVPLSPILLAAWCWKYELPYWDIATDISQNSLYFMTIIFGSIFLISMILLLPGFARIWEDYTIYKNGAIRRTKYTENIREIRWNVASLIASSLFIFMYIFVYIEYIFKNISEEGWEIWAIFLSILVGISLSILLLIFLFKRTFRAAWKICLIKAERKRWKALKFLFRYTAGDVSAVKFTNTSRNKEESVQNLETKSAERKSHLGIVQNKTEKNFGYSGVFILSAVDMSYLGFFLSIYISIIRQYNESVNESYINFILDFIFIALVPIIPVVALRASKTWADGRSPQTALATVIGVMIYLAVVYPGIAHFIDKLSVPLNFGGNRLAHLYLSGSAACVHTSLFKSPPPHCETKVPSYRTDAVKVAWIGQSKVIIRPQGKNAIVFDRKDVLSYEIISIIGIEDKTD